MKAGESLSTPAQLVPLLSFFLSFFISLFSPVHRSRLLFRAHVRHDTWIGRTTERFSVAARPRTNKWDGTDDTAHIVLRHIPWPGIVLSLFLGLLAFYVRPFPTRTGLYLSTGWR